jgi:hypothetical protein
MRPAQGTPCCSDSTRVARTRAAISLTRAWLPDTDQGARG